MEKSKLDALLWEQSMFDNYIIQGATSISQKNLDDICFENVDELNISRDEDYNIKVTCIKHDNSFNSVASTKQSLKQSALLGAMIPEGTIELELFNDFKIIMNPCYYKGSKSEMGETEYKILCYHVEGKSISQKCVAVKEWLLNGNEKGLCFCVNGKFKYMVEGTTYGLQGDIEFPRKQLMQEQEYLGNFVHVKYKDTAFDVHYVGSSYGPKWSRNVSISYYEHYGRIPNNEEREIIREYISFFAGKQLLYTGESEYDENGNVIGFVMDSPRSYGMDIKRVCANAGLAPISDDYKAAKSYFDTITGYLEKFEELYIKLDFRALFSSYWYAHEIAKPMDLPILSSALEHLMKKWYSEIGKNPETVLMDKKDFSKRVAPIKEIIEKQFYGTDYVERMKNSISNMNRMSVNERFNNFFVGIGLPIGPEETKALRARDFSAHGSFRNDEENYYKQFWLSRIYECLIARVVLKLLGYDGNYKDYGMLGIPEKNINCPSGSQI